jgi:F-type H+-transporting ATPase subunit gamma
MASTQVLKARIRSVKSTKQITKAMQLVAASKMRRAQDSSKASMPYAMAARELLTVLSKHTSVKNHPLFVKREVKSRLLIVIASDKGLAGAYNSNIIKAYVQQLQSDKEFDIKNKTIAVGRKIGQFATRIQDVEVLGFYENIPDRPSKLEFRAILDTAIDGFLSGEYDAVDVIFTKFVNSIRQKSKVLRVLPAGFKPKLADDEIEVSMADAIYEPDASEVIEKVAHRLVSTQVFQAFLDAKASEHSMRMLAMKNATDNANDLTDDLTLAMNKARQGAITQELAEISGGVEALNE